MKLTATTHVVGIHPVTGEIKTVHCIDWFKDEVYFDDACDVAYPIDACKIEIID